MMQLLVSLLWTQIWQLAVLFVVVWVVTHSIKRRRPHFALLLWVLFFIKCLVPPIFISPVGLYAWQSYDHDAVVWTNQRGARQTIGAFAVENELMTAEPKRESPTPPINSAELLRIAILVWGIGVLFFFILTAGYFWRTRRKIWQTREPMPDWLLAYGEKVYATTGLRLDNRNILISDSNVGPLVLGFFRPRIVLPREIGSSREMTLRVLAHEACHIWRRDHWLSALQLLAQALFWFHPMVWFACRETNRLCEICCDDDTLRLFDMRSKEYAKSLVDMLEYQRTLKTVWMVPGIRPVEITKERLRRLLSGEARIRFRKRLFVWAFVVALLVFPSGGTTEWAIGFQPLKFSGVGDQKKEDWGVSHRRVVSDEIGRKQMDFFVGAWQVESPDGTLLGHSEFLYEPSGNMIREEWTSVDGATAEGITYYDPNRKCWVITWVDNNGTIMDSKGAWDGNQLRLTGTATRKNGKTSNVRTLMTRKNSNTIKIELFVEVERGFRPVSTLFYRR